MPEIIDSSRLAVPSPSVLTPSSVTSIPGQSGDNFLQNLDKMLTTVDSILTKFSGLAGNFTSLQRKLEPQQTEKPPAVVTPQTGVPVDSMGSPGGPRAPPPPALEPIVPSQSALPKEPEVPMTYQINTDYLVNYVDALEQKSLEIPDEWQDKPLREILDEFRKGGSMKRVFIRNQIVGFLRELIESERATHGM